ncbi:BLUF domain-containing protein [Breoghania sp.]|uniref:BLUF domain-containing protein n=1 Tax=Breoghania sp. TaxID=2065378 RepID=UPI002AA62C0A|nr:BLUF domain-containing protein [Breoghania sp.]
MGLYQICYRSRIRTDMDADGVEREVDESVRQIRQMNALNGITGALILTDTHIFHLMEGQVDFVSEALERALADPRHEDVTILSRKAVEYRLFHDSWLYFADLRLDHGRELPAQLSMIMPRPQTATAEDILALMAYIAGDLAEAQLTNRLLQI